MQKIDRPSRHKGNTSPKRSRLRPRWTKEEVSILRRLYRTHSNAEIAQVLGRRLSSVIFKGHRLGLSKGRRRLKQMGRENIRKRWQPQKHKARTRAKN